MKKIYSLLLFLLVYCSTLNATAPVPTKVQSTSNATASATTLAQAFGSNVTSGNLLLVVVSQGTTANGPNVCTDTLSNTFHRDKNINATNATGVFASQTNLRNSIQWAISSSSGADTVTCTMGVAVTYSIIIMEYSGVTTDTVTITGTDEAASQANASSTSVPCPTTATTNGPNALVIQAIAASGAARTVSVGATGFTAQQSDTAQSSNFVYDKTVTSLGTQTATGTTINTAVINNCIIAVFDAGPDTPQSTAGANFTLGATDVTDDAGVGSTAWTTPNNGSVDDANYATLSAVAPGSGTTTTTGHYLKALNFGFSVTGTVTGVLFEAKGKKTSDLCLGDVNTYNALRIFKAGAATGNDRKLDYGNWTTTEAYIGFGGKSDMWGTTWSSAEVNANDFGIAISEIVKASHVLGTSSPCNAGTQTVSVNAIRATVFFVSSTVNNVGDDVMVIGKLADGTYQLAQTRYAGRVEGR